MIRSFFIYIVYYSCIFSIICSSNVGVNAYDDEINVNKKNLRKTLPSNINTVDNSRELALVEENKNCCDLEKRPGENGNPICADSIDACCPDGEWSCGIGDGTFICGGVVQTRNPTGFICSNNELDDIKEDCCDSSIQVYCMTGSAKCCPEGVWACPGLDGSPFGFTCPTSGTTNAVDMNGLICEKEDEEEEVETSLCCDPFLEPGALNNPKSFEGHQCCPNGKWGYSIGDATNFACDEDGTIVSNPNGKICDICSLPPDSGPCEAAFPTWYFSIESERCEEFSYGGCDGNANKFKTKSDCEQFCPRSGTQTSPPLVQDNHDEILLDNNNANCCDPLLEPGVLNNPISREGHRCCPDGKWGYSIGDGKRFGCGGQIMTNPEGKICDICSLPSDSGSCKSNNKALVPRWYFNAKSQQCDEFTYGGCDGNANNFQTKSGCQQVYHSDTRNTNNESSMPLGATLTNNNSSSSSSGSSTTIRSPGFSMFIAVAFAVFSSCCF